MEENKQDTPVKPPTNKAVAWTLGHKPILAFAAVAAVVIVATAIHFQTFTPGTPLPLTKSLEYDGVSIDYPKGWEVEEFQGSDYALISSSGLKGDKQSPEQHNGYVTITTHAIKSDFNDKDALEVFNGLVYDDEIEGPVHSFDLDGHEAYSISFEKPSDSLPLNEQKEEGTYAGTAALVKFDNICTIVTALGRMEDGPDAVATANAIAESIQVVGKPKQATAAFYSGTQLMERRQVSYFETYTVKVPTIKKGSLYPTGWDVVSGKGTMRELKDGSFTLTDASGDVICMAQWGSSSR